MPKVGVSDLRSRQQGKPLAPVVYKKPVSSSIVQSTPGAHWQKTFLTNYIIRSNKDYFNYTSHLVLSYKEHV